MLHSCRPTIAVRDKESAKVFFGQTLGLSLVDENPVGATFQCGRTVSPSWARTEAPGSRTLTGTSSAWWSSVRRPERRLGW